MGTEALVSAHDHAEPRLRLAVAAPRTAGNGEQGVPKGGVSQARLRELSHDVRHPCATIRALAAAIEVESDLPESVRTRLAQIVAEARRVEQLCADVLAASARRPANARVDRVLRDLVSAHPRLDVVADQPLAAQIDELDLRRILWNLIDNAVRAAGPVGTVVVSSRRRGSAVVVEVADDGPGFGASDGGAAGLGLGIVESLVRRSGGRVEIDVADLGGVAVRVVLPGAVDSGEEGRP